LIYIHTYIYIYIHTHTHTHTHVVLPAQGTFQQVNPIYRVIKAEYDIHVRVAASQENVNTYSTRRVAGYC